MIAVWRGDRDPGNQEPHRSDRGQHRHDERCEVGLARDVIRQSQHEHPERVRIGLNALGDIPARTETGDEIVDGPERDVGVVAHPGSANDRDRKQAQQGGFEKDACVEHRRGRRPGLGLKRQLRALTGVKMRHILPVARPKYPEVLGLVPATRGMTRGEVPACG